MLLLDLKEKEIRDNWPQKEEFKNQIKYLF
jgi:hypothetical protein